MVTLVLELPPAVTSVDEGLERLKKMIQEQHAMALSALTKANDFARVGHTEDAMGWALEASDAHRRAAILEDAWGKISGSLWETDWSMPAS